MVENNVELLIFSFFFCLKPTEVYFTKALHA